MGFAYKPVEELSAPHNYEELAHRLLHLEALQTRERVDIERAAPVLVGTVKPDAVTITKALEIYLTEITLDEVAGKSPEQRGTLMSLDTSMMLIIGRILYARTDRLISVLTFLRRLVRKCVAPIQDLSVPNGCSTVALRMAIASGRLFNRVSMASMISSLTQRLIRRCFPVVHLAFTGQTSQPSGSRPACLCLPQQT